MQQQLRKTDASVTLGTTLLSVRVIPADEALFLLFEGAMFWSCLKRGMAPSDVIVLAHKHFGFLLQFVASAVNREALWVRDNATLSQLVLAFVQADELNGFSESFAMLEAVGWVTHGG